VNKAKFDAIFPVITAALVDKIAGELNISDEQAIEKLYTTSLYSALEREETKVWQYSTEKLYELYLNEKHSGKLVLPEY
jgi:hypothetical protein